MTNWYRYDTLDRSQYEFRILTLHPGVGEEKLRVSLRSDVMNRVAKHNYEALSYVWGPPEKTSMVQVEDATPSDVARSYQAPVLGITESLKCALLHLRLKDTARELWIDAICINQEDPNERGHQVSFMASIYQRAFRVVVFLGPATLDSSHAMALIEQVGRFWDNHKPQGFEFNRRFQRALSPREPTAYDFETLYMLVKRDWFDRLWVRQEISHGGDESSIMCGHDTVTWRQLRTTLALLQYSLRHSTVEDIHAPNIDGLKGRLDAVCFAFDATDRLIRLRQGGREESSWRVLSRTAYARCLDPRDRIYALLSLNTKLARFVQPDYTLPVRDLYKKIMVASLGDKNNPYDLLPACGISLCAAHSPSWVRDWSKTDERCLGLPNPGMHNPTIADLRVDDADANNLVTSGIAVATIAHTWDFVAEAPDTDHWFRGFCHLASFFEWTRLEPESRYYKMDHSSAATSFFRMFFSYMWYDSQPEHYFGLYRDNIFRCRRHEANGTPDLATFTGDADIWAYLQFIFRGRSLFVTTDGSFGTGPVDSSPGDVVMTFLGSPHNFMMRSASLSAFEIVGTCDLDQYMEAQAFLGPLPAIYEPDVPIYKKRRDIPRRKPERRWIESDSDPRLYQFKERMTPEEWTAHYEERKPFNKDQLERWGVRLETFTIV